MKNCDIQLNQFKVCKIKIKQQQKDYFTTSRNILKYFEFIIDDVI